MNSDTDDQKQAQIIEDAGTTTEKEKRLTLEAEKLIRRFMVKWVSLPAIFLAVMSFALGFFIEKVAFQTASNQAFQSAQSEVMKLVEQVMDAKHKADAAAGAIQSSSKEISKTEDKSKKFAEEFSSLQSKFESTVAFQTSDVQIKRIAEVLASDPRITTVLNNLDNSIQTQLKKADEEIEKIKSAYRIDCQEGKTRYLGNFKKIFAFPFPVKRAWVEPAQIDEVHDLMVNEIKGDSVTIIAKHARYLRGPERSQYEKKRGYGNSEAVFHVWATSF